MPLTRERWTSLWIAAVPRSDAIDPFADLARRYDEAHRHYHNASHINACLALLEEVRPHIEDPLSLELALWFHDAVYEPRASDNEERSANLAAAALQACDAAPTRIARVTGLIIATKTHQPAREPDAPWMLDIDLAVLGAAPEIFAAYDAGISEEYAWVEPAMFRARRAEVLAAFLARPQLYLTPHFRERFEHTARANLQRTLRRLAH